MALPADVTVCTLSFGPYDDATGAVLFAGMVGWLTPSTRATHPGSGAVIIAAPVKITLGSDSTATVQVPHTTQTTTSPTSWTYTVRWDVGRFADSPGNLTFTLPPGVSSYDFDTRPPMTGTTPAVVGVAVVA